LADRFSGKFVRLRSGECWPWIASLNSHGYGYMTHDKRKVLAHRASWTLHRGQIPDGIWVLHNCDTKNCVNPSHLFLGTAQDNSDDMNAKLRFPLGEEHWGSRLTEENVLELRARYAAGGITMQALADEKEVGYATAREAIRGITWAWLPGAV